MFSWLKKFLKTQPPPRIRRVNIKIWGVVEGPFFQRDLPDQGYDPDAVMMIMKLEDDGDVFDAEVWMDDFDQASQIIRHFKKSITPLEIEMGEETND